MSRILFGILVVVTAGSTSSLAQTTCPPGTKPAQGTLSYGSGSQGGVVYAPPSTGIGSSTQLTTSGGTGGGSTTNCVPITTDSNKNRKTPTTPTGTTNKNRGVTITPTSK
jgi:hypothetical protein